MYKSTRLSHPTWVRGLKHTLTDSLEEVGMSHPTWVRGLKLYHLTAAHIALRRTLRGCVD